MTRKPSHLASYCMPAGMSATSFASMGETGGMTGRSMVPILRGVPRSRALGRCAGDRARRGAIRSRRAAPARAI